MSDPLPFPLVRFGGKNDGPRLLISAGVHGDEYLPMLAVQNLIRFFEENPEEADSLQGSLTLIPIVNQTAFALGERCGADGKDLARSCPGSPNGTTTEQAAAALSREIEAADFYIDIHTGGTEMTVFPLTGYILHSDEKILDQQRNLARAFQLPFCWGTSGELEGRSLSIARDAEVPAIYIEYNGSYREVAEATAGIDLEHPLVHGCFNAMRHLGIIAEEESTEVTPEFIEDTRPNSGHMQICHPAPATGFCKATVELGQTVKEGDLIAQITTAGTLETHEIHANRSGKIIVLRDYPRINEDDAFAVIAEPYPKP